MLLTVFIGILLWNAGDFFLVGKEKAEHYFSRDKTDILIVTNYLEKSEHQVIYINDSDGSIYVGYNDKIDDEIVVKALERLFNKQGYQSIEKNNNTIHFLRWTRLMDFGSGFAYSINAENKPVLPHLTKLEPLSEDGWYYYEEDYNK